MADTAPKEKIVSSAAFESVIRAYAPLNEAATEGLRKLGLDPEAKKLRVAYPYSMYVAATDVIVAAYHSDLPAQAAHVELGRNFVRGYEKTLLGKAVLASVRILGPRRFLTRLTAHSKPVTNFIQFTVKENGPTDLEIGINYSLRPGYYQGLLEEGLRYAGAKNVRVELMRSSPEGSATWRARWDQG